MLSALLKTLLSPRSPSAPAAAGQATGDERSQLYQAALADAQAGRIPEAIAGCEAALALDHAFTAAHNLLAALKMPGENYFQVLARIQAHLHPRTYVEIGVDRGDSIRIVGPETRALGVDPEPKIDFELASNVKIFAQTSDDFFAQNDVRAELGGLPIDLAFIDGMHHLSSRCATS